MHIELRVLRKFLLVALVAASSAASASDEDLNTSNFDCCYRVVRVAQNDVLNVRAEPGRTDTLTGTIPADASGIRVGRCVRVPSSNASWCLVNYQSISGWVAGQFLSK